MNQSQSKGQRRLPLPLTAAAVLLALSTLLLLFLDLPLRASSRSFPVEGGAVSAGYAAGKGEFGVLIAVGEGLDNSKLQSVKRYLHDGGAAVLTLQLPAGQSGGEEALVATALETLLTESGLPREKILLLGYGERAGGLLATAGGDSYGGLVLISPTFPTGWVPGDIRPGDGAPATPVLILGTSSDSAPSPQDLTQLYNRLSGDTIKATGFAFKADRGDYHLRVVSGVVDAYQAYSATMLRELSVWVNETLTLTTQVSLLANNLRSWGWLFGVLGLGILVGELYRLALLRMVDTTYSIIPLQLESRPRFFATKLLLWATAVPVLLLVVLAFWLFSIDLPIWGMLFCGYLFSYGAVQGLLLCTGRMPGVKGKLTHIHNPIRPKRVVLGIFAGAAVGGYLLLLGSTGLFALLFTPQRTVWFLLFSLMGAVGFYFFLYEATLLDQAKLGWRGKLPLQITPLIPLVALAIFSLPAASFTALLTLGQYLVVLILSLLMARLVELLSGRPTLAAITSGMLLGAFVAFAVI